MCNAGYSFIRNKVKINLNYLIISREINKRVTNIVYVIK